MKSKIVALSKNEDFKHLLKKNKISNKYITIFFGSLNNKNNKKLNNFINYFLDDHIELVNDDYFCLIKEFIINKCELGLIVSQLFIVELLSYYNILKSLGYHIVNEDNLSINFDDLNIIYDFLIVKN